MGVMAKNKYVLGYIVEGWICAFMEAIPMSNGHNKKDQSNLKNSLYMVFFATELQRNKALA